MGKHITEERMYLYVSPRVPVYVVVETEYTRGAWYNASIGGG